jgi:hypothetical protein
LPSIRAITFLINCDIYYFLSLKDGWEVELEEWPIWSRARKCATIN